MADRVIGVLPISVGTSLALEPLIGNKGEPIQTLMLNLSTLFRNAYQAYETDDRKKLTSEILYKNILEDITGIYKNINLISTIKEPKMVPYFCTYAGLETKFPKAKLWHPKTPLQLAYAELERVTLNKLVNELRTYIVRKDFGIPEATDNAYVVTHHVVDLINAPTTVKLLESHTGVIKEKGMWYTKLNGGEDLKRIPFNSLSISVFGDKSVNFKAHEFRYRAALLKIANDNKWTSLTSRERVKLGIGYYEDKEVSSGLLELLV